MQHKHAQDLYDSEIADAFFGGGRKSVTETKVERRQRTMPGIIAGLALSLFFVATFFTVRAAFFPGGRPTAGGGVPASSSITDKLIDSGLINRSLVEKLTFEGGAKQSAILKDGIMLVNGGDPGSASLDIVLARPVDFNEGLLFIKGNADSGIKYADLILTDSESRDYKVSKISFSPKGDIANVPLDRKPGGNIDFGKIEKVRIEFGTETAGNARGTVLYIRDLYLRKLL